MSLEKCVDNFLGERFKSYVLIAYDYEGNNVNYSNVKTQEEMDSMLTAIDRTMQNFMDKNSDSDMEWEAIEGGG